MRPIAINPTVFAYLCGLRAYEVRYALRLIRAGREGYSTLAMRVLAELERRGVKIRGVQS